MGVHTQHTNWSKLKNKTKLIISNAKQKQIKNKQKQTKNKNKNSLTLFTHKGYAVFRLPDKQNTRVAANAQASDLSHSLLASANPVRSTSSNAGLVNELALLTTRRPQSSHGSGSRPSSRAGRDAPPRDTMSRCGSRTNLNVRTTRNTNKRTRKRFSGKIERTK